MRITLRAGDKFYLNGAVIRADRKVCLEILNDATFLLHSHVMQIEETTTPLRQLYFILQTLLMDPQHPEPALSLFAQHMQGLRTCFSQHSNILESLTSIENLVQKEKVFDSLKVIRSLFPGEEVLMLGLGTETHVKLSTDTKIEPTQAA